MGFYEGTSERVAWPNILIALAIVLAIVLFTSCAAPNYVREQGQRSSAEAGSVVRVIRLEADLGELEARQTKVWLDSLEAIAFRVRAMTEGIEIKLPPLPVEPQR